MNVGVIGSGAVGQTLAAGFLKHGHKVAIGTRDPAKLKDWAAKHAGARRSNPSRTPQPSARSSRWRSAARRRWKR